MILGNLEVFFLYVRDGQILRFGLGNEFEPKLAKAISLIIVLLRPVEPLPVKGIQFSIGA
jgi:hypothetical protein